MASKVEIRLNELATNNSRFKLLSSQWIFDKQIIGRALTNISNLFSHYSMHDASHSEVILSRISSLLGEGISQLSGTDLWLMLEAAYLHDAGMIIPAEQRNVDLKSDEFKNFIIKCSELESDIGVAARELEKIDHKEELYDLEENHRHLFIVYSEYIRKKHATRAGKIAVDPTKTINADTPRNTLVPKRLWYLIGQICKAHGENKDFLFQLPYQENGIGEDLCHPRFIASMLRIGDLLDLDSDRFCPSINSMMGELPDLSKYNKEKHIGIRHLLVNRDNIEVQGVYTNVDAYLQAEQWFNWLREELIYCTLRWDKIDPRPSVGHLPTIGKIEARLEDQVILESGARPQFELDREKILDLVKGSNIYEGPQDALRELVQNSIDATLLRYSYEARAQSFKKPKNLNDLRLALENYPIQIKLKKQKVDEEKATWRVSIKDKGLGLRLEDIKFMLKLGSSRGNEYRQRIKNWLPKWAKPSGAFGIGFHSIFSFVKTVTLTTRHPESNQTYRLEFESTQNDAEPKVIVKKIPKAEDIYSKPVGTTVEFDLQIDKIPTYVSLNYDHKSRVSILDEYDFVKDDEIEYVPAILIDTISELSRSSLCKFDLEFTEIKERKTRLDEKLNRYFDSELGLEVVLQDVSFSRQYPNFMFKGAMAKVKHGFGIPMLSISCNILTGSAKDFLEINRNKFTSEGRDKAYNILTESIENNFKSLFKNSEKKGLMSLYSQVYLDTNISEDWKDIEIDLKKKTFLIKKLLSFEKVTFNLRGLDRNLETKVKEGKGNQILIENVLCFNDKYDEILHLLCKSFNKKSIIKTDGQLFYVFEKNNTTKTSISVDAMPKVIEKYSNRNAVGARFSIPCSDRYRNLEIPKDYRGWGITYDRIFERRMPSPISKKKRGYMVENLEHYVDWLAKKKTLDKELIKEDLINFFEDIYSSDTFDYLNIKGFEMNSIIGKIENF